MTKSSEKVSCEEKSQNHFKMKMKRIFFLGPKPLFSYIVTSYVEVKQKMLTTKRLKPKTTFHTIIVQNIIDAHNQNALHVHVLI